MVWIQRLLADESGNVAFMFALLLSPILVLGGLAIDYSRVTGEEATMQSTLDNAVASSGIDIVSRRIDAEKEFTALINANSGRDTAKVKISIRQDTLRIEATDKVKTPVLSITGRPQTEISALVEMDAPSYQRQSVGRLLTPAQQEQLKQVESQIAQLLGQHGQSGNGVRLSPHEQRQLVEQMQRQLQQMQRQMQK